MNTVTSLIYCSKLIILTILLIPFSSDAAENIDRVQLQRIVADRALYRSVQKSAVSALSQQEACITLVGTMLQGSPKEAEAMSVAAKISWICGRPSDSISLLEQLVAKHGDEVINPGGTYRVAANMWIGTITRHCGDLRRADEAYRSVLSMTADKKERYAIWFLCHLYQAEISEQSPCSRDDAIAILRNAADMKSPTSLSELDKSGFPVLQEWAQYELQIRTMGAIVARSALAGNDQKTGICSIMIRPQSKRSGAAGVAPQNLPFELDRCAITPYLTVG